MLIHLEPFVRGGHHYWTLCLLHKCRHCPIEAIVKVFKDNVDVFEQDESFLLALALLFRLDLVPPHLLALSGLVQLGQQSLAVPAAAGIHLQDIETKLSCKCEHRCCLARARGALIRAVVLSTSGSWLSPSLPHPLPVSV